MCIFLHKGRATRSNNMSHLTWVLFFLFIFSTWNLLTQPHPAHLVGCLAITTENKTNKICCHDAVLTSWSGQFLVFVYHCSDLAHFWVLENFPCLSLWFPAISRTIPSVLWALKVICPPQSPASLLLTPCVQIKTPPAACWAWSRELRLLQITSTSALHTAPGTTQLFTMPFIRGLSERWACLPRSSWPPGQAHECLYPHPQEVQRATPRVD